MFLIKTSTPQHLPQIADCQLSCFPTSFATKLGKTYVQKTLEWFLANPQRFLFHCEFQGRVVGYCGGFAPAYVGDGSSSGMLQHAFKQAVSGVIKKPWLLFHAELVKYYPLIFRNIKKKIIGNSNVATNATVTQSFDAEVGLVIIGIHPEFRGKGVFELLMDQFEAEAAKLNRSHVNLSVRTTNVRAINAYKKAGWLVRKTEGDDLKMHKFL